MALQRDKISSIDQNTGWNPMQDISSKQQARQKHKTNQQTGFLETAPNIPLTQPNPSEGKKKKNHPLPLECRHKSHPTQRQHRPLKQAYTPRTETKGKKEYNPKPRKRRPLME